MVEQSNPRSVVANPFLKSLGKLRVFSRQDAEAHLKSYVWIMDLMSALRHYNYDVDDMPAPPCIEHIFVIVCFLHNNEMKWPFEESTLGEFVCFNYKALISNLVLG